MTRQPNGRPSISQSTDGWWHCYVTVGRKTDGSLDRKHIRRRTAGAVATAVDELQERISRGTGLAQKVETVEQWLLHWLEHVVEPSKAWKTHAGYRSLVTRHVIPALGQWKLDGTRNRLEPEYVEAMYAKLRKQGLAPSYVLQVHRVLRKALKDAVRRGKAARNVCDMIDPPRARRGRVDAHSLVDTQAILGAAMSDPLAGRWLIGMLLGPRQGEALSLRWHRIHLDADSPYLAVATQLQRRTWRHGCKSPVECATPRCRTKACPPRYEHGCDGCGMKLAHFCPARRVVAGCSRHQRPCPPVCRPGCTDHARGCPDRVDGGLLEVDVKSEKGERDIPLPPVVEEVLRQARERQIVACRERGVDWDREGLVFTNELGGPIDPRADHAAWERLLVRAGVADTRLHAARHTAATFMVASGTDIRVVQEILGHSHINVTAGYADAGQEVKRQAVDRIASALMDGQLTALLQGTPKGSLRPESSSHT